MAQHSDKSQEAKVLNLLQRGKPITQKDAIAKFRCYRLSARIMSLRQRGFNILTERMKMKDGGSFGRYWLIDSIKQ